MHNSPNLERICSTIKNSIDDELDRVGFYFRSFSRVKTSDSVRHKISTKGDGYYNEQKRIQDIIGIRIILYYPDDIEIVCKHLKTRFRLDNETIDANEATKFAPRRVNLVFKIPSNHEKEFNDQTQTDFLDTTFEVQIRTILSEGWHEIDHDLRYKCKDDWTQSDDLERSFNGILATLETSEYALIRLFEQLSYRHYKTKDIEAIIRTKFRLRIRNKQITEDFKEKITEDFIKQVFKCDRADLIDLLIKTDLYFPLTIENIVFFMNYFIIKNGTILKETPSELVYIFCKRK